ncbi:integrase, catalytic region, zinc finger, CCHC-type containing protein [Tanacetum coccineum]
MMANLSEDIQCASSDTRLPMLDMTDFESWQQRIHLYCLGKDNEVNILRSIDEGPFKMGKFRETLAEGVEGALHLGPEQDRVFADLTPEEKERFKADIHALNILLQGLPKDIYTLINHYTNAKDIWDNVKMLLEGSELTKDERESQLYDEFEHFCQNKGETIYEYYVRFTKGRQNIGQGNYARVAVTAGNEGVQNRVGNANPSQARQIKCYNYNGIGHIAINCTQLKRPQNSEYFKKKMLLMQARENGAVLDDEHLLFIAGGQTNTFYDDVDEAPVQDLALNEDNVFQVDQCDVFDSDVDEAPTAQTMFMANLSSVDLIYDEASPSYDSDILSEVQDHDNYVDSVGDEYVKDNALQVVQSNVSSMPNDALMIIINDMYEQSAQCVSTNEQNKVVNESLTAELARYKEQVQLYEKGQELLKKELHSVKMQLNSTINHNKLIKEEVTMLKQDFKQKENKYLEEFLNMKQLKEKVDSKIKIAPPDYSKENYLANFTPQRQLTPEQIFWSSDIKDLTPKPMSKMTVYPPNTPAKLVPRVLPTKIQKGKGVSNKQRNVTLLSVLNDGNIVSKFFETHDAYTVEQARCLELKAELSKLKHKIQKDDHKRFRNNKSQPSQDTPEFDTIFEINKMKASLQRKDNAIRKLKEQISQMNERRSEADRILDFKALETENEKVKQHYKKLYESIKITRAKTIEKTTSLLTKNEKLKAQLKGKMQCVTMPTVKPKVLTPGVNSFTKASESKPRSNTKNNRILPAKSDNKKKVEAHPRNNKSKLKQKNHVDSSISSTRTVVQIVIWYLDSGCSKHMTGNRSRLKNFVKKFIGTVRFRNDHFGLLKNFMKKFIRTVRFGNGHFGAIMGYGDYVIDLEVEFRKQTCYVRNEDGVDLLKGSRGSNLYTISVEDMMKSSPIYLLSKASKNKSWLWHRQLNHLNFSTINDLTRKDLNSSTERHCRKTESNSCGSYSDNADISKALMFLWAEAVATACYTQNRSLIHTRHNKTPYELVHDKKPDLKFLRVFCALCYPTNDNEDLGKLKAITDIGIFVGYTPNKKGYRIYNKRT